MSNDPKSAQGLGESDLAQDRMGTNRLEANDQNRVRNQRHTMPEEKRETEGVVESFETLEDREQQKADNRTRSS
ncbi:hypothetical protein [Methylobrevis pamukkalensis]|uniref:Uncharacterized protein n=1 Tax=Methylobrevis pamukkalensis TaxID=1439726 RepID=A0A1E3H3I4_9HYPH|nr:hypothetical protein [Methylobrevis pamukkalensis]ODN70101.1 hypothetical protein A6302_02580 [Methylobrevis pamukkalensis]